MAPDAGHHCPIVAIRVQALDGFAQRRIDCRIARIAFGGVEQHAGFVTVGRNAGGRLDYRNDKRTRNPGLVEYHHQNPAPVAIGIDAVGSSKESVARRLHVCTGKFDQDMALIAGRRNSLRRIGDVGESVSSDSLFLCERDEHLLMIAVTRNRICRLEKRFPDRRVFVVRGNSFFENASLISVGGNPLGGEQSAVSAKVLWSSPWEASIFERTRAWSPSEEMELAVSK